MTDDITFKVKPILMLTNCDANEEADQIADDLVLQKLAAAVQIIGPTNSRYHWAGEVHRKEEWLLVIKTTNYCEARVKTSIQQLHSYQVPSILTLDITGGDAGYLQWILNNATLKKE